MYRNEKKKREMPVHLISCVCYFCFIGFGLPPPRLFRSGLKVLLQLLTLKVNVTMCVILQSVLHDIYLNRVAGA